MHLKFLPRYSSLGHRHDVGTAVVLDAHDITRARALGADDAHRHVRIRRAQLDFRQRHRRTAAATASSSTSAASDLASTSPSTVAAAAATARGDPSPLPHRGHGGQMHLEGLPRFNPLGHLDSLGFGLGLGVYG